MITLEQLRTVYKPQILALADQQGVENIRVFGSVARGEQTESSDVDFLIKMRAGCGLWEISGLLWRLEDLLKTDVQLVDEKSVIKNAYPDEREHIFNEAVPLGH